MARAMTGSAAPSTFPELGPFLGHLASPDAPGSRDPELEPVRLAMLSALFERAGRARAMLARGDAAGSRGALSRETWLGIWGEAVAGAAGALLGGTERRLRDAALVSRIRSRRIAALLPGGEDRRILGARLASAGIGLEQATLELARDSLDWDETVRRCAGELTGAWDQLMVLARQEREFWDRRIADVRSWRRPWRPFILGAAALLLLAAWLGLVLGGYLPVPGFLRPLTDWYWSLPWP
jgi:hypothetical protein